MSDAALMLVNSLSHAVETTLNPTAPQADRHAAYSFIEEFKEKSPFVSEVGALLAKKPGIPILRSFGLQLLEHSIRFRWNDIPIEEKVFIKESVMDLLKTNQDILVEAVYVKEGIARLVVEMAKREWPQQWGSFFNEIFEDCLSSEWKAELALTVLLRLSEDVGVLENVENPKRRRDMFQQFTADLPQILEFLDRVLTHYVGLLYLEGAAISDQLTKAKVIQAALRAISCIYEWCSLAVVGEDKPGIGQKLFRLLHDQRFRILAAECLSSITSRREPRCDILLKFFEQEYLEGLFSAAASNTHAAVTEESYGFDKKCAEVFINLGSLLFYQWGKNPNFKLPETAEVYFKALVSLADHDSVIIREAALAQIYSLLQAALRKESLIVDFVIPLLVPVLIRRLPKVGYPFQNDHPSCKLSLMDFDSDEDFNLVFQRCTSASIPLLKFMATLAPDLCFKEALSYMSQTMESVIPNLSARVNPKSELFARAHAAAQVVDCVCEALAKNSQLKQQHFEDGMAMLHRVMQMRPVDIRLHDELINSISAFIYCCRTMKDMRMVVEYCIQTLESNDFGNGEFKTEKQELRRHSAAVLIKAARCATDYMMPLLDELISVGHRISTSDKYSMMDGIIVKDSALILINEFKDNETKAQYLLKTLQPLPKQWRGLPVEGPNEFLEFYGLSPSMYEKPIFRERRFELASFLLTIRYLLNRIRPVDGKNAAFQIIAELLPNIFRLAKVMTNLYAWSSHAPKDLVPVFDLSKGEKLGLLSQGIADAQEAQAAFKTTYSCDFITVGLKFIPVNFQYVCDVIALLGYALGEELYRIPGLAGAVTHSLLGDLKALPEFRQKVVIKTVISLVEHCPALFYDDFVIPLIGAILNQVGDQLNSRWLEIIATAHKEGPDKEETDSDVLADCIIRDLSKELLELVKVVFNGPVPEQPRKQSSDENEEIRTDDDMGEKNGVEGAGQGKSVGKTRPISDLAKAVLSSDGIAQTFLTVQIRSLCWPDSTSCIKSTNTLNRTLDFMEVHIPNGDIGIDLATSILVNCLHALEVNGQHDANRDALFTLILRLFNYCGKTYPTLQEVLDRIPQPDEGKSLDQFRQLSRAPISAKTEKQKRDVLRKIVEPFVGKHSGQLYKREVHMKSLPSLRLQPRKVRPPLEETEDTIGLVGLFGSA